MAPPTCASSASRLRLLPPRVPGAGNQGVVVTGVDGSGIASEHGLSTGDVILEVAGKSVSTPADVRNVVATARTEGKRTVLIRAVVG